MSSSLPSPSPALPIPIPSPSHSIRPSKLELLQLLREQREQQLQAASAQSTPSLASTSDTNTLPPSSASSTSSGSKVNMGAILGGVAGGLFVLALILVAIIVPLQRRRRLRSALAGSAGGAAKTRRRINFNFPFGLGSRGDAEKGQDAPEDKERESMIGGKTYPTVRTHRTTGSQAPLLGGERGDSAPSSPTRPAFSEPGGIGGAMLDQSGEAKYPVQSSTHLYQGQQPASGTPTGGTQSSLRNQERQQKQPASDKQWFHYRMNSTEAPPILDNGTAKNRGEPAGRVVPEFDPYSPFEGTASPLEGRFPDAIQLSDAVTKLERPAPAATPSSPKKYTRDIPLPDTTPFIDVDLNDTMSNLAGTATVKSRNFDTGKSSVDIYTCIDNPFMSSSERNQATPAEGARGQAAADGNAVKEGGPSWFSYHSSSVRSGLDSRAVALPPTFVPTSSTFPIDARNPTRQVSLDSVSDTDSESMYSQMSLSRSTTAMSATGSVIRYGSVRAQASGNGGSGFMPVVHEGKEDTPTASAFSKEASATVTGALDIDATPPPSPFSANEDDHYTPKATPAAPASSGDGANLCRMDTFAIGALLKTRANKVAVERSDSVVEKIERKGSIWEIEGASGVRRQARKQGNEEVVVRGRGVSREEAEEYSRITRAPIKPSTTSTDQTQGRSRSQSRGRLVPKASAQRLRGTSSDNEGGIIGGSEEGGSTPARPPIGRSSSKYKPKGLQQRSVEKGLLSGGVAGGRSRSASGDAKERVRADMMSVPVPVEAQTDEQEKKVGGLARGQGGDGEDGMSSAVLTPSPSPEKGKKKNDRNPVRKAPPSNLDSALLSPPPEHTKASDVIENFAANPLTGAFGLGQSPDSRSPATPTSQYAFAELESAKGFLPKVEGLNVSGSGGKKKSGK